MEEMVVREFLIFENQMNAQEYVPVAVETRAIIFRRCLPASSCVLFSFCCYELEFI